MNLSILDPVRPLVRTDLLERVLLAGVGADDGQVFQVLLEPQTQHLAQRRRLRRLQTQPNLQFNQTQSQPHLQHSSNQTQPKPD